jgi:CBS domain-containing protein
MAVQISEVMAPDPITVTPDTTVTEAARRMRTADIGDVIVVDGQQLYGIVTDRDIVIRAVADDRAPSGITVGEICSAEPYSVKPDDSIDRAVQLMREQAIRRLPVTTNGRVVGVVSIGDLSIDRDVNVALADISTSDPTP